MNIASPWTITWDSAGTPLVLVTAGQELGAIIKWPCKQRLEEVEMVEGEFVELQPRKQKLSTVEFTVLKDHATFELAWAYVGTVLAAVPWDTVKALDFARSGGVTLRMSSCGIESVEPHVTTLSTSGKFWSAMKYTIKGRPPVQV